jgi:NifU-like protein involved in Fe-S cluster formation
LRQIRSQMHAMLKEGGPPPSGKWQELEALLPVRDFKARHASTLLTFDAVVDAVDQIEAKAKTAIPA